MLSGADGRAVPSAEGPDDAHPRACSGDRFPIAHVHWTLPPVVGGVETHLADLARLQAGRGHPVTLFAGRGNVAAVPGVETVPVSLLSLRSYALPHSAADDAALAGKLAEAIRPELVRRGIRIVHGHNLHYFSPVPAMALNLLRDQIGIRLHHTYHSMWPDSPPIAEHCRSWPGQHALSDFIHRACVRTLRIDTVHTAPGVAHDRFGSVPPPSGVQREQVVLLPARLFPEKGAHLAVRMLEQLRREHVDVRLILTSPPDTVDWARESADFRKSVEDEIAARGLGPHVEFQAAGFTEMPSLYAQADVVIYPSTYPEPLGLAPLEAAAAGRPVVVTRTGGLPETVDHGVTGYVIAPDDLDELTDRVRTLLVDRARARRMGEAGRLRVRRHFALSRYVEQLIRLYRTSLGCE